MSFVGVALAVAVGAAPAPKRFNVEPFVLLVAGAAGVGVGTWRVFAANAVAARFDAISKDAGSVEEAQAKVREGDRLRFLGNAETQLAGALLLMGGALVAAGAIWLGVQGLEVPVAVFPTHGGGSIAAHLRF